jgi:hypothetical protein
VDFSFVAFLVSVGTKYLQALYVVFHAVIGRLRLHLRTDDGAAVFQKDIELRDFLSAALVLDDLTQPGNIIEMKTKGIEPHSEKSLSLFYRREEISANISY